MEMNKNLLIVGAGIYGVVAKEIAESMGCFEKIDFVDDERKETPNGIAVVGTVADLDRLACQYGNIIVAIAEPKARLCLLKKLAEEYPYFVTTLVSPRAFVSPSAQIMAGSIIEPMAVIQTGCVIGKGCIISAGAVIDYASMCCDGSYIGCHATVVKNTIVPAGTTIDSGEAFKKTALDVEDLFFNYEALIK